jgi:hypothetical protein
MLLPEDIARLLRWDHSSVVASEVIPYYTDLAPLLAFLKAFTDADSKTRERDMSVGPPVPEDEAVEIRAKIAGFPDLSAERVSNFQLALQVFNVQRAGGGGLIKCYASVNPDHLVGDLISRATRCWVVFIRDDHDGPGQLAYYKRAWRYVEDHLGSEGDILQRLSDAGVRHLPTLLGHADLEGGCQKTLLGAYPDVKNMPWASADVLAQIRTHQQYEILVEEVGTRLEDFPSSKVLAQAVHDALVSVIPSWFLFGSLISAIQPLMMLSRRLHTCTATSATATS